MQEEVQRRTREEEQQRQEEKQRGMVLGFNPQPSKYLDLDQLQIQGVWIQKAEEREGGMGKEKERKGESRRLFFWDG